MPRRSASAALQSGSVTKRRRSTAHTPKVDPEHEKMNKFYEAKAQREMEEIERQINEAENYPLLIEFVQPDSSADESLKTTTDDRGKENENSEKRSLDDEVNDEKPQRNSEELSDERNITPKNEGKEGSEESSTLRSSGRREPVARRLDFDGMSLPSTSANERKVQAEDKRQSTSSQRKRKPALKRKSKQATTPHLPRKHCYVSTDSDE